MLAVPPELTRRYEARLAQQNLVVGQRPHYHQWLRYYLDFCGKYSFVPVDRLSLPAFQEKLQAKHQPEPLCQQAGYAVSLYWETISASPARLHPLKNAATPPGAETRNAVHEALDRPSSRIPVEKQEKHPVQSSTPPSTPAQLTPQRGEVAAPPARLPAPTNTPSQLERASSQQGANDFHKPRSGAFSKRQNGFG